MQPFLRFRNGFYSLMLFIALIVILLSATSCNSNLFYQPKPYHPDSVETFIASGPGREISYETSFGTQYAYYLTPIAGIKNAPSRIWVLFGGINSLALGWIPWFESYPDSTTAFLLIEYPGYGCNSGTPRVRRINESAVGAFNALDRILKNKISEKRIELGILGHSLGSGTALQFAVQADADRLVLISPFTSLNALTAYRYGSFLGTFYAWINPENYKNTGNLMTIMGNNPEIKISIIHGTADKVIPAWMGRELAALGPQRINYYELKDVGHSALIKEHITLIHRLMLGLSSS